MKPMFSIHPGEYLVGDFIEKHARKAQVWLPSKDTGVDLLVTNQEHTRAISLQVKFSKDFLGNKAGQSTPKDPGAGIKAGGWWTFNYDKMKRSPADLWILVLHRFTDHGSDFVIMKPGRLLALYRKLGKRSGMIQSYLWVTKDQKCWETRGVGKADAEAIEVGKYRNSIRDLSVYLNDWGSLEAKLGFRVSP